MTLGELIATAQELADDAVATGLWTPQTLTIYANEAERQAARRARLLIDADTLTDAANAPLCRYSVLSGASAITLHPKVIFVRRVKLGSQTLPLPATHVRDMDRIAPGWEDAVAGAVVTYIPNWQRRKLRFYNKFAQNDTVNLQVVRLPLVDMANLNNDSPEIDPSYHMGLVHGMLTLAFMKPDSETEDQKRSAMHRELFEQEFGPPSSANDEMWIQHEHGYDQNEGLY